jgi:Zinc finger, C2H2 type
MAMAAASNAQRSSALKEYRCSICSKIFDSAETLNSHKRIDHSQEGYQPHAGVS